MEQLALQVASEIARQVPSLIVFAWMFWQSLKSAREQSQLSEARLQAANDAHHEDQKRMIVDQQAIIKSTQDALAVSNTTLGGITVLLTLVEKDLKEAKRAPRT